MVKIRYAGVLTGYHQRFVGWDRNQIACTIITEALAATTVKFDNNIKFNRFDAVDSYYEVTLKCKSSRGKGAKVTREGRHLISCCWHVWETFFDELLRLNPNIVIIAQGNHIDISGGNREDRNGESEMCECGDDAHLMIQDAFIDEPDAEQVVDHLIAAQTPTYVTPANRSCSTCMYSSQNTSDGASRCPVGRCMSVDGLQNWMPVVSQPPTPQPRCNYTCRHNSANNEGVTCDYGCHSRYEHWEAQPPSDFVDEPNTSCSRCEHSTVRTGVSCPYHENNTCFIGNTHRKFKRAFVKNCITCEHNYDKDGNHQGCFPIIGSCVGKSKWKLYQVFVYEGTPTSHYDTQMVEQDTQIEQKVECPMIREE